MSGTKASRSSGAESQAGAAPTDAIDRYFFGDVATVRPWLLERFVLVLLAVDCFVLRIARAGRYGAGGFNVAHFRWLDAIAPVPSASGQVHLTLLTGFLALLFAISRPPRAAMLLLSALYTYTWAISQLDSYQHHYLLSWFLVAFALFPRTETARDAITRRASAWAYVLVLDTCAVVYAYTAYSKLEPEWRSGTALRSIVGGTGAFDSLQRLGAALSLEGDDWWRLVGSSVVLLQVGICTAYVLTARRDAPSKWLPWAATGGMLLAVSFHVGAELLDLEIGWFSWYMIGIAVIAFSPARILEVVSAPIARAWDALADLGTPEPGVEEPRALTLVLLAVSAGGVVVIAALLDVPGASTAGVAAGIWLAASTGVTFVRHGAARARPLLVSGILAALTMWLCVAVSDARYDYYRFTGGDLRRRGDLAGALHAYEKANRYAPPGKSRQDRVDSLRRALRAREHRTTN